MIFDPTIVIFLVSIFVVTMISLFQKIFVKKNKLNCIKEDMKEHLNEMKKEQKAGNTEKANELLKEIMNHNSRL